jgi:hypothetical protein
MQHEKWGTYHIHAMYWTPRKTLYDPEFCSRRPSTAFFNSSDGTTTAEAVNVQHISIFGICEDEGYFANSPRMSLSTVTTANWRITPIHMLYSGAVRREGRTILGAKSKLHSEITQSRKKFGIGHMHIYTYLLRMTDTMSSQNTDLSSWDTWPTFSFSAYLSTLIP